jgi:hypothetical protein
MTTYTITAALREQLQHSLQAQCGGRCNNEYNPCEASELDAMLQSTAQPDHLGDANKMVPLTDEDIVALAHRKCWRYKRSSDPHHSDTYLFNLHTLLDFARKVEKHIKGQA